MKITHIMQGAEPYYQKGESNIGCLVLHGFCASPHEVLWLAQHLARQNLTVLAPTIAGHGTSPEHLARTQWQDWLISAIKAYHILRQTCDKVIVGGLSMGALLSLLISTQYHVDGVFALAAPVKLKRSNGARFIGLIKYLVQYTDHTDISPFARFVEQQQRQRKEQIIGRIRYNRWPSSAVHELMKLIAHTDQQLPFVTAPLLSIYSKNDDVVSLNSETFLRKHINSSHPQHHILEKSGHILTQDLEQETVFQLVTDFVQTCAGETFIHKDT